jgi:halocyanin-like protein
MTDGTADVSRRAFMRTAAGATTTAVATGTAAAQEEGGDGGSGGGPPDFGSWFSSTDNFDETVDETGNSEVTVQVGVDANGGAFGYGPAAVHVDNGATVQFEWTGEGGAHNVISDGEGPLDSGSAVDTSGVEYEHTFEEDGIYKYYCVPHEGLGMKGAIVVGSDYPTASSGGGDGGGGGGGGGPQLPESVKSLGVATSVVMTATLGLAYVFMKYGGDYEAPE